MPWIKNLLATTILAAFCAAFVFHLLGEQPDPPSKQQGRYKHLNAAKMVELTGIWGTPEHEEPERGDVVLSADGKLLLSARGTASLVPGNIWPDTILSLWDVERGEVISEIKVPEATTMSLAISENGKVAIATTASVTKEGKETTGVVLVDLQSSKTTTLTNHQLRVYANVAINPKGNQAAVCYHASHLEFWDLEQKKSLKTIKLKNQNRDPNTLLYSTDGNKLLIGDPVDGLRLLNVDTGNESIIQKFPGNQRQLVFIARSSDGKRIANTTSDETIKVWEAISGKEIKTLGAPNSDLTAAGLVLTADGKKAIQIVLRFNQPIISLEASVRCFDVSEGKELWKAPLNLKDLPGMQVTPDGKQLFLGGGANPFMLLDLADGKIAKIWGGHKGAVTALAVDANDNVWSAGVDRSIKVWDAKGKELKTLLGHKETITSMVLAGDKLVSGSADKTLKIWDTKSGKELHTLTGHTGNVSSVAVTPDGERVVSGGGDRMVRIWDVAAGKELHALTGHGDGINAVAVSPDGKWIASAGDDNRILLWPSEPKQDVEPTELAGHERQVTSLAFTADGKHLIAGSQDKTISLWDVASAKKLKTFAGHKNWVHALAVRDNMVISASDDLTMRVWNVQTGKEVETLDFGRAQDLARCFAFQRSQRTLLVGTAAGVILRFEIK